MPLEAPAQRRYCSDKCADDNDKLERKLLSSVAPYQRVSVPGRAVGTRKG